MSSDIKTVHMDDSLIGEQTIAKSMTLEILTSSVKLPPIPANGAKLLAMIQTPVEDIDITKFSKLVEIDPGLLSRVLQLANSPYYSEIDEIVSLKAAITRIGLTETINSVCLYFFKGILPGFPEIQGFSSKEYWAYSWGCALANRRLGHPNLGMDVLPGQLYLAGLLHGIGKLMTAIHFPDEFNKCLAKARKFKLPLYKVERDIFGTTDAFVAASIMDAWSLPESVCNGVAFCHMPQMAPEQFINIAALTQLSYSIAGESGIGKNGDGSLLNINDTYVCRHPGYELSKKATRDKLIKEILALLSEKSESITEKPLKTFRSGKSRTPGSQSLKKNRRKPAGSVMTPPEPKKKGIFAAIMSWFSN